MSEMTKELLSPQNHARRAVRQQDLPYLSAVSLTLVPKHDDYDPRRLDSAKEAIEAHGCLLIFFVCVSPSVSPSWLPQVFPCAVTVTISSSRWRFWLFERGRARSTETVWNISKLVLSSRKHHWQKGGSCAALGVRTT